MSTVEQQRRRENANHMWQVNWSNDYDLYQAILEVVRENLRRVPSMTAQTLGLNVINSVRYAASLARVNQSGVTYVETWGRRAGAVPTRQLVIFADDVIDFGLVSQIEVGHQLLAEAREREWIR